MILRKYKIQDKSWFPIHRSLEMEQANRSKQIKKFKIEEDYQMGKRGRPCENQPLASTQMAPAIQKIQTQVNQMKHSQSQMTAKQNELSVRVNQLGSKMDRLLQIVAPINQKKPLLRTTSFDPVIEQTNSRDESSENDMQPQDSDEEYMGSDQISSVINKY